MAPGLTTANGSQPTKHPDLSSYRNPSLHVTPNHTLSLHDSPIPTPSPTQVLLHIRCTGICGSDMHLWHTGRIGPLVVDRECILGHEASGVVLSTGTSVTHLQPGDRGAVEPGVPCHNCWLCNEGKYNLCEAVEFAGVCPYAGSIRRFMVHEGKYCHKIPDGMTFAQGALLEPLSVIFHAVRGCGGNLSIGRPALVCGAGPIGLIALACAKANGAWPLVITDVDEGRLEFAKGFVEGVKTYKIEAGKDGIQLSEEIRKLYGCEGRDVEKGVWSPNEYLAPSTVLECTGIEASIVTAAYTVRRSGTVMVVGVGKSVIHNLPFMHLSLAEIKLLFINRYTDTWPAGINALADHRVLNLDKLVTHTFPLEKAVEAMETCADRKQGGVKVQIVDDMEIKI